MSTVINLMIKNTHKDEGLPTAERIFSTIADVKGSETDRTAKLVSLVVARLVESGKLTEEELDDMLLQIL